MSADLADSLDQLGARVDELSARVERLEKRVLRWGAVLVLGAEAARMFLPLLIPELGG